MNEQQFQDAVDRASHLLVVGDFLSYLLGCQALERLRRYVIDTEQPHPDLERLLPRGYQRIPTAS